MTLARLSREEALAALEGDPNTRLSRASAQVAIELPADARMSRMVVMAVVGPVASAAKLHGRRVSLSLGRSQGK